MSRKRNARCAICKSPNESFTQSGAIDPIALDSREKKPLRFFHAGIRGGSVNRLYHLSMGIDMI